MDAYIALGFNFFVLLAAFLIVTWDGRRTGRLLASYREMLSTYSAVNQSLAQHLDEMCSVTCALADKMLEAYKPKCTHCNNARFVKVDVGGHFEMSPCPVCCPPKRPLAKGEADAKRAEALKRLDESVSSGASCG